MFNHSSNYLYLNPFILALIVLSYCNLLIIPVFNFNLSFEP